MKLDCPLPPEKETFLVACSRDYVPDETPAYAHDWDELLAQAERSLESRRAAYPAWIASGKISAEEAEADIQAWEWIVAEWRWILTGEGGPPPIGSLSRRRAAVTLSLQRIEAELRRGNHSLDMRRQAHVAMALLWQLDRVEFGKPAVHFSAHLNQTLCRERRTAGRFL